MRYTKRRHIIFNTFGKLDITNLLVHWSRSFNWIRLYWIISQAMLLSISWRDGKPHTNVTYLLIVFPVIHRNNWIPLYRLCNHHCDILYFHKKTGCLLDIVHVLQHRDTRLLWVHEKKKLCNLQKCCDKCKNRITGQGYGCVALL